MGTIISLISGQDFPPDKYNSNKEGIPYIIGASNIIDGDLQITRWTTTPSVFAKEGDLLLVCKGAGVGKMCMCELSKAHIARQIQSIRVYSKLISIEYIKDVLTCRVDEIISKASGLIPGLNRELILNFFIPIPPFNEQETINQTITSSFDLIKSINRDKFEVSNIINKAKSKVLDLAIRGKLVPQDPNDEPASVLLERIKAAHPQSKKKPSKTSDNSHYTFSIPESWKWCQVSDFLLLLSGRDLSLSEYSDIPVGIPYITGASNIVKGELSINRWTNSPKVVSEKNDLLITCKGTIGEIVINNVGQVHIARQLMAIRKLGSIEIEYIYHCLNLYIDQIKKRARGIIPGISREDILFFYVPLPPLKEQKLIVKKIKEIFNSLDEISNSIIA